MFRRKNLLKLSDEEVLRHYKVSGNTEYFGELYTRYIPILYGIGLKYLQNADKAEDAVMQLFESILPKISQYEINIFRHWICSVMKNHCLQILRKDAHEIIVDSNVDIMESDDILYLLDDDEMEDERKKALKKCLKKLPIEQRIAIIRFYMEEMSYLDIAESTGYRLNQVKSYIQNGKRNLKICMQNSQ